MASSTEMVEFIGAVGTVVSVTDTLLDRIDKREENLRERTDVRDALVDLLHVLREWWRCAFMVNYLLEEWIEAGKPADFERLEGGMGLQWNIAESVLGASGYATWVGRFDTSTRSPQATISDVLFVYAPDLERDFRTAVTTRMTDIERLRRELEARATPSVMQRALRRVTQNSEASIEDLEVADLARFRQSEELLEGMSQKLAAFIAEKFGISELSVYQSWSEHRFSPPSDWQGGWPR
jgi:hypothetical protein